MERARRGNQAALTELVERHHLPLVSYLYYATSGQRFLAEDLAQEAMFKLVKNLMAYQAGRPFKPWLYTIAANLVRDHFRRLETRKTEPWSEVLEANAAQPDPEPETALLLAEQNNDFSTAILKFKRTAALGIYAAFLPGAQPE